MHTPQINRHIIAHVLAHDLCVVNPHHHGVAVDGNAASEILVIRRRVRVSKPRGQVEFVQVPNGRVSVKHVHGALVWKTKRGQSFVMFVT